MKSGRSLPALAIELKDQLATKKDLLVPSSLLRYDSYDSGESNLGRITIDDGQGIASFGVTDLARRQLAEKLRIPFSYFERMRCEQPELLDRNVNTWLRSDPDRRLLRTLSGNVRAVLSDRYRRLDNIDLANAILPTLEGLPGARFESVELTETRMYLKVVTPRVEYEIAPGDVVQAGVAISNSEVGCGTLSVQPLVYRLVCSNGMIAPEQGLRKTHVGRIHDAAEQNVVIFQDDTLRADDQAFYLKVRVMCAETCLS